MNLREMKQILAENDLWLTKSLGQNFLHDGNQLRRIVASGELTSEDQILEIGPGLGPLTDELLKAGCSVLAVEKDERLIQYLRQRYAETEGLELIHADALAWLRSESSRDWRGWKLVANLPYSVGSPILVELALAERGPDRLVATLQMEVIQRIRAVPKTKEYGVLSLLLQLHYRPVSHFKVPAGCFYPQPDVTSACISLVRRSSPLLEGTTVAAYIRLVKVGFGQRRKVMLKLLKTLWPESCLREAYAQIGLDERVRAEAVSVEQFVALATALENGARVDPKKS